MKLLLKTVLAILFVFLFSNLLTAEVTVKLVEPAVDTNMEPCSNVMVKAEVTATAGEEIQYVYLMYNGRTLRRLKEEPYEYELKNVQQGIYWFQARAQLADKTDFYSDVVKVKAGDVHGGEKLLNGSFNCATLAPWTGQQNAGAIASFTVHDDGYFDDNTYVAIEIENGGEYEWHVQFAQPCPMDSGHAYTLSFLADADEKKTINVSMQENQEPWATQASTTFDIDGADLYTFEFEATRTDPSNVLRFNVGLNTIPIYLDDISVVDHSATSVKSKKYDVNGAVAEYELFQAYPNPFNMNTTIRYSLSNPASVVLDVYNMQGQKVKTLVDEAKTAGMHSAGWNGVNDAGDIVPTGVYFYKLIVNDETTATVLSRKVLLLK